MARLTLAERVAGCRRERRNRLRERTKEEKQRSTLGLVSLALLLPGAAALGVYTGLTGWSTLGVALLIAVAAFAAGALVGFLFGIPRTLATADAGKQGADGTAHAVYGTNTNLEQISDWLTKILVGVGLVQIGKVGGAINDLANGIGEGLGKENGHAASIMLMISFTIAGFLCSYLYTRMRLQPALEPGREFIEEREEKVTNALPLVRAQLDPSGEEDPSVFELAEALYAASSGIRDEAFYLARNQRRANWRGVSVDEDKGLVALVIPVFEALIQLDKKKQYHRNHAELGYALKDQEAPDYEAAKTRLTEAIERRGERLAPRFPLYEFNRAVCEIRLDPAFNRGEASDPAVAKGIRDDLAVAEATRHGRAALEESPGNDAAALIASWRQLN